MKNGGVSIIALIITICTVIVLAAIIMQASSSNSILHKSNKITLVCNDEKIVLKNCGYRIVNNIIIVETEDGKIYKCNDFLIEED